MSTNRRTDKLIVIYLYNEYSVLKRMNYWQVQKIWMNPRLVVVFKYGKGLILKRHDRTLCVDNILLIYIGLLFTEMHVFIKNYTIFPFYCTSLLFRK